jgi:hypothetical protein
VGVERVMEGAVHEIVTECAKPYGTSARQLTICAAGPRSVPLHPAP